MSPAIQFVSKTKGRLTLVAVLLIALVSAVGAIAYWTTSGTGTGDASAGTLTAPTVTDATPGNGTVALTWSSVTPPGSGSVSYYVSRDGGTPAGNCPTTAAPSAVLTCTDSGVSTGSHDYTVTALWRTWTATSATTTVTVAAAQSLDHFTVTPATGTQTSGAAFSVTVTAKDSSNATITSYVGTIQFTSNDGQAVLPADYTFLGGDNGSHTFTSGVTLNTAGAGKTVTVTDSGKTGTATYTVEPELLRRSRCRARSQISPPVLRAPSRPPFRTRPETQSPRAETAPSASASPRPPVPARSAERAPRRRVRVWPRSA